MAWRLVGGLEIYSVKAIRLRQKFPLRIFARQRGCDAVQRPFDANGGVVPSDATLELSRPEICGFVEEFRSFA